MIASVSCIRVFRWGGARSRRAVRRVGRVGGMWIRSRHLGRRWRIVRVSLIGRLGGFKDGKRDGIPAAMVRAKGKRVHRYTRGEPRRCWSARCSKLHWGRLWIATILPACFGESGNLMGAFFRAVSLRFFSCEGGGRLYVRSKHCSVRYFAKIWKSESLIMKDISNTEPLHFGLLTS